MLFIGVIKLKTIERILIKVIFVQFIFLLFSQLVFHHFNLLPELNQITQYEGVSGDSYTKILETFLGKD